jgi:hypothetical protein
VHPSCQTLGVVIALGKKKCQAGEDFAFSHRSSEALRQGAACENTDAVCCVPDWCRIGLCSGKLPPVK